MAAWASGGIVFQSGAGIGGRETIPPYDASVQTVRPGCGGRLKDRGNGPTNCLTFTNREIAGKLDRVEQTVERKLRAIRQVWSREESP
jgi:hypothetical protein